MEVDGDGDGLSDWDEVEIYYTDPLNKDTDNDGINDGKRSYFRIKSITEMQ